MHTYPTQPNINTLPTYPKCLRSFRGYTLALLWAVFKFVCARDRYQKAKHLQHILTLSHDSSIAARLLLVALATTAKL